MTMMVISTQQKEQPLGLRCSPGAVRLPSWCEEFPNAQRHHLRQRCAVWKMPFHRCGPCSRQSLPELVMFYRPSDGLDGMPSPQYYREAHPP
jgi:hypothetical protein